MVGKTRFRFLFHLKIFFLYYKVQYNFSMINATADGVRVKILTGILFLERRRNTFVSSEGVVPCFEPCLGACHTSGHLHVTKYASLVRRKCLFTFICYWPADDAAGDNGREDGFYNNIQNSDFHGLRINEAT